MGMRKNFILSTLLAALPLFFFIVFFFGAYAQEGETLGGETVIQKNDEQAPDSKDEKTNETSGAEEVKRESIPEKKEVVKKQEKVVRKKKEIKREAEKPAEKKEHVTETPAGEIDRSVLDGLFLIDHDKIRHNRIPGYKPPEEGADKPIVSIPKEDARKDASQDEDKGKGGIFGKNTGAIAGWGLLVIIFIIFAIYSKTRGRAGRRRVVRNYPKR